MTQYIDKAVVVAELERRISGYQANFDKADNKIAKLSMDGRIQGLKCFLSFLNTLNVKEVDLEKEKLSIPHELKIRGLAKEQSSP